MNYVMACACGHEQPGTEEQQKFGRLYRCGGCKQVWAAVLGLNGWKRWVRVAEGEVEFYGLMTEPEPAETES